MLPRLHTCPCPRHTTSELRCRSLSYMYFSFSTEVWLVVDDLAHYITYTDAAAGQPADRGVAATSTTAVLWPASVGGARTGRSSLYIRIMHAHPTAVAATTGRQTRTAEEAPRSRHPMPWLCRPPTLPIYIAGRQRQRNGRGAISQSAAEGAAAARRRAGANQQFDQSHQTACDAASGWYPLPPLLCQAAPTRPR